MAAAEGGSESQKEKGRKGRRQTGGKKRFMGGHTGHNRKSKARQQGRQVFPIWDLKKAGYFPDFRIQGIYLCRPFGTYRGRLKGFDQVA